MQKGGDKASGWHPTLFTNLPRAHGRLDPDTTTLARDAAMRTSAAPTFFPVHQGFVDGAIFANNPSLMAMARVFESYPHISRKNVSVLSLGCGEFKPTLRTDQQEDDWGYVSWARHLPELLLTSNATATEAALEMMLGEQYCRFDIALDKSIALDDHSCLKELVAIAAKVRAASAVAERCGWAWCSAALTVVCLYSRVCNRRISPR
jgi:hypothetical protein